MRIDHTIFFRDFPARTGLLLATRRSALDGLLSEIERDTGWPSDRLAWIAYFLATIRWETGHSFLPVAEKRIDPKRFPKESANQFTYWKTGFYGRGYVQLTHEANYRRAGTRLAGRTISGHLIAPDSFVRDPELVRDPGVSYAIASRGMRDGWFTGKKLSDYLQAQRDFVNARRIINGLDQAKTVAEFADQFHRLLQQSTQT